MERRVPKPHQEAALLWSRDRRLAGFFIDKRLGKCLVSVRWALSHFCRRVLIVAPLSSHADWLSELEAEGQSAASLAGDRRRQNELLEMVFTGYNPVPLLSADERTFFCITNPQSLFLPRRGREPDPSRSRHRPGSWRKQVEPSEIAKMPWECVIIDECTWMKNPKAQVTQVAQMYLSGARCRTVMSGDPAPEGPFDLFEPLRFISDSHAVMGHSNFWKWRNERFDSVGYSWTPKPGTSMLLKACVDSRCFVLTRKQAGYDRTPSREVRQCELPAKIRKAYDHAERYFEIPAEGLSLDEREVDPFDASAESKYAPVVHSWLAQLAGGYPKNFPALRSDHKLKVLGELLDGDYRREQLVVSFRHRAEIAAAAVFLGSRKVSYALLTGGVPVESRKLIQASFQRGETQVILGQCRALCFGINLSAADTMVRFSLPGSYEEISQPADRIEHMDKKVQLHYIDIVAKDTVDEDRLNAYYDKRVTARYYVSQFAKQFEARRARKWGTVPGNPPRLETGRFMSLPRKRGVAGGAA